MSDEPPKRSTPAAPSRTTSMVPSRAGSSVITPSSSRASTPQQGGGRMLFRPVMPQRRRTPSAPPAATPAAPPPREEKSAPRRPPQRAPRQMAEMTATGPFALGSSDRRPETSRASAMMHHSVPRPVAMEARGVDVPTASIDIEHVQDLDPMAPQSMLRAPPSLKREMTPVKMEAETPTADVNTAQALDLSESEDEGEDDAHANQFATSVQGGETDGQLFLFQFPRTFPSFQHDQVVKVEEDATRPEGQIGRLDVYADGRVALRIGDIPFDVTSGSEASFLQQVVILDAEQQVAQCLGEVHSKLVVTPNLDDFMHHRT